ncbi:hypothetical protein A9X05_09165 [Mycobacterium sp. E3298]|nr:hypothetical protein [Mycobacterium sp. E3298]OBG93862.1 hypothetical protein A9X05_09165 [Mycobacterium sp. E3298]
MKQHIFPKQATEIGKEQFYSLFDEGLVDRKDWANYHHKKMTIGKMIEVLTNMNWNLDIRKMNDSFRVSNVIANGRALSRTELCDALWEAVKGNL